MAFMGGYCFGWEDGAAKVSIIDCCEAKAWFGRQSLAFMGGYCFGWADGVAKVGIMDCCGASSGNFSGAS